MYILVTFTSEKKIYGKRVTIVHAYFRQRMISDDRWHRHSLSVSKDESDWKENEDHDPNGVVQAIALSAHLISIRRLMPDMSYLMVTG